MAYRTRNCHHSLSKAAVIIASAYLLCTGVVSTAWHSQSIHTDASPGFETAAGIGERAQATQYGTWRDVGAAPGLGDDEQARPADSAWQGPDRWAAAGDSPCWNRIMTCHDDARGMCGEYTFTTREKCLSFVDECRQLGSRAHPSEHNCRAVPACEHSTDDVTVRTYEYDLPTSRFRDMCMDAQGRFVGSPEVASPHASASDLDLSSPRALREAQTLLLELGYAPGVADGIWGTRSEQAYRAFLRDAGLAPSEELTPEALEAMRAIAQQWGIETELAPDEPSWSGIAEEQDDARAGHADAMADTIGQTTEEGVIPRQATGELGPALEVAEAERQGNNHTPCWNRMLTQDMPSAGICTELTFPTVEECLSAFDASLGDKSITVHASAHICRPGPSCERSLRGVITRGYFYDKPESEVRDMCQEAGWRIVPG